MTRGELAFLSQAHAVAFTAIAAPDLRCAPVAAAFALREAAAADMPVMVPACTLFVESIRASRGRLPEVADAGRQLRDAVAMAMAFVPVDAGRVDIHGP
jgi:hypothetical protein